jgi:hypothetical protein
MPRINWILFLTMSLLPASLWAGQKEWTALIAQNGLAGWKAEGNATWKVENGVLIGRQGAGGSSGDLYSVSQWKDFELEAEWKMHWPGNSGMWFRVGSPQSGYQADFIDQPSHPGVYSGSLYCMGKAFIAENHDAQSIYKDGWNKLRIRAEGDHFVVTINGKKVVDVRDATFPGAGSVGIQVHAGSAFDGMEVQVRNLRMRNLGAAK